MLVKTKLLGNGDKSTLDVYTLAHIGFGVISHQMGLSMPKTLLLATLYELIEDDLIVKLGLRQKANWNKEIKYNAIADILAAYLGYKGSQYFIKQPYYMRDKNVR